MTMTNQTDELFSITTYKTTSASEKLFPVGFKYLKRSDVKVYCAGVLVDDNNNQHQMVWHDNSTIKIAMGNDLGVAIPPGTIVRIERETFIDQAPAVFSDGAVLRSKSLNDNTLQVLYATQESVDRDRERLGKDNSGFYDVNSTRITQVADPVDATDAVNKQWVTSVETKITADVNRLISKSAVDTTNEVTRINEALESAISAQTKAEQAAASALGAYQNFSDNYLGAHETPPSTKSDGTPLQGGELYFSTIDSVMKIYNSTIWTYAYVSGDNFMSGTPSSFTVDASTDPKISFDEGSSGKAKVGWNSTLDRATLENTTDNSALLVSDLLEFTPDGTTQHKVFHKGNTVGATQNVMETTLTESMVCVTDENGYIAASTITAEQLGYLGSLTSAIPADPFFPSGTRMVFNQASAPTGWTKSDNHNDKALRVVSGTTGDGGLVGLSNLETVGTFHTSISGNVGNTTLSSTQIPSHSHSGSGSISVPKGTEDSNGSVYGLVKIARATPIASAGTATFSAGGSTGSTGGGKTGTTSTHTHDGSSLTAATDFAEHTSKNLNLAYVDVIIAQKDGLPIGSDLPNTIPGAHDPQPGGSR